MATTDSNDSAGKQRTQPMTGISPQPTGFETLRPDTGIAPFAETAPPGLKVPDAAPTPAGYSETMPPGATPPAAPPGFAETMAPTKPTPAQSPADETILCGYKLTKLLGRGGFGKVWLGEAAGGVPVAVKVVEAPRDSTDAAQRELQALETIKQLRHPFLVMTHAFYSLEDKLVIAMELADGSLRDELNTCRRNGMTGLKADELVRLLVEAAEALDYLHDKKMTHRDIKPENILMLSGHAKLADFGLVRVVQENRAQASVSLTGTLAYMAPEVFRGHTHKNSDQYALALTYLELRFGERFVTTNDLVEAMLRHVEHEPDLSRLEPHEREVIKKALAKDPEQRWRSCTEMARALAEGFGRTEVRGPSARANAALPAQPRAVTPPKTKVPSAKHKPQAAKRKYAAFLLIGAAVVVVGVIAALVAGKAFKKPKPDDTGPDQNASANPNVVLPVAKAWKVVPAADAKIVIDDHQEYYSEVDLILDDATSIRFILIRRDSGNPPGTDVRPFYIMRDKVWYRLFERFAASGIKLQSSLWKEGVSTEKGMIKDPDWPVMNVGAEDALKCADWLGGDLPGLEQWKKAVGYYDQRGQDGPFDAGWKKGEVGNDRPTLGPLATGESTKDRSVYRVRDMAGNGKEWTHVLRDNKPRLKPGMKLGQFDAVIQLGKSFADDEPLHFTNLDGISEARDGGKPDEYCGFRVVLNLP